MRFIPLLVSVAVGFGSSAALATPASSAAMNLETIVQHIESASRRAELDMLDKLQARTVTAVTAELDGVAVAQPVATFAAVPIRVAATALTVRRW